MSSVFKKGDRIFAPKSERHGVCTSDLEYGQWYIILFDGLRDHEWLDRLHLEHEDPLVALSRSQKSDAYVQSWRSRSRGPFPS